MRETSPPGLPAALALAHLRGRGRGRRWSLATWSRVWIELSPNERGVIYLHAVVGLPLRRVAGELDVSPAGAHRLYHAAASKLVDVEDLDQ